MYEIKNVNEAFDIFLNILNKYISSCTVNKIQKNNKFNKLKPWINSNLIGKINVKNNLFKKLKQFPNERLRNSKRV